MSLARKVITEVTNHYFMQSYDLGTLQEYPEEANAITEQLKSFGIEDVKVSVHKDGSDWLVEFEDADGDYEIVSFGTDDDGHYALVLGENDNEIDEGGIVIDLDTLDPPENAEGMLELKDMSWMTKSVFMAILAPEDIGETMKIGERFKYVVRGGKKTKLTVRTRKKRLTSKQKISRAKAGRKRKGKRLRAGTKKKRALSMKIRKRVGLGKKRR